MTKTNNDLFILMGNKNDGKTTNASYIIHKLNKPCVVIDPAREFQKKDYRIFCYTIEEFLYYMNNENWQRAIKISKMQIICRPPHGDAKNFVNKICKELMSHENYSILFDEMELYADRYLTKKDEIYNVVYLLRNRQHDIVVVSKKASELSGLIKDMFDYIFVGNLETKNSLNFFKDLGGDELVNMIKKLRFREFLIVGRRGYRDHFKLNNKIAKILS